MNGVGNIQIVTVKIPLLVYSYIRNFMPDAFKIIVNEGVKTKEDLDSVEYVFRKDVYYGKIKKLLDSAVESLLSDNRINGWVKGLFGDIPPVTVYWDKDGALRILAYYLNRCRSGEFIYCDEITNLYKYVADPFSLDIQSIYAINDMILNCRGCYENCRKQLKKGRISKKEIMERSMVCENAMDYDENILEEAEDIISDLALIEQEEPVIYTKIEINAEDIKKIYDAILKMIAKYPIGESETEYWSTILKLVKKFLTDPKNLTDDELVVLSSIIRRAKCGEPMLIIGECSDSYLPECPEDLDESEVKWIICINGNVLDLTKEGKFVYVAGGNEMEARFIDTSKLLDIEPTNPSEIYGVTYVPSEESTTETVEEIEEYALSPFMVLQMSDSDSDSGKEIEKGDMLSVEQKKHKEADNLSKLILIGLAVIGGILVLKGLQKTSNNKKKSINREMKIRVEEEESEQPKAEEIENLQGFKGIIVDEEKVKEGICKQIDGTNLVFMEGVVGALNKEQRKTLCKKIIKVHPSRDIVEIPIKELLDYVGVLEKKVEEIEKRLGRINNK